MIKAINKLNVGVQYHDPLSVENPPLAFMVPDNSLQGVMKDWCGYCKTVYNEQTKEWNRIPTTEKIHVFDNIPMHGFKIEESVSRWSTSNKWFRVSDPRGFMLEISADNLCNILLSTKVEYGKIKAECAWCRDGSVNVLVPTESKDYKEAIDNTNLIANAKKIPNKELKPLHKYKTKGGKTGIYLGVYEKQLVFGDVWCKDMIWIGYQNKKNSHTFVADLGLSEITIEYFYKTINEYKKDLRKKQMEIPVGDYATKSRQESIDYYESQIELFESVMNSCFPEETKND